MEHVHAQTEYVSLQNRAHNTFQHSMDKQNGSRIIPFLLFQEVPSQFLQRVYTNSACKTCNPHEMTGDNYCDEEDPSGNGDNLGEYLITQLTEKKVSSRQNSSELLTQIA